MTNEARLTLLARLGFAARGVVYALVGWFAVDAAIRGGRPGDNQGAIASLADEPLGGVMLAVIAAGLLGYAIWRLLEAVFDPERLSQSAKGAARRAGYAVSGIAHLILAWSALRLAMGTGGDAGGRAPGDATARDWTALLLEQPAGRVLVMAVAACILAAAVEQALKAWRGSFVDELGGGAALPEWVRSAGRLGYGARAVVFTLIAFFFAAAALHGNAGEAGGIGQALSMLQGQPGGKLLLGVVGLGLAAFGFYGFVEARFRRIKVELPG